jgi:hypothetical protein
VCGRTDGLRLLDFGKRDLKAQRDDLQMKEGRRMTRIPVLRHGCAVRHHVSSTSHTQIPLKGDTG